MNTKKRFDPTLLEENKYKLLLTKVAKVIQFYKNDLNKSPRGAFFGQCLPIEIQEVVKKALQSLCYENQSSSFAISNIQNTSLVILTPKAQVHKKPDHRCENGENYSYEIRINNFKCEWFLPDAKEQYNGFEYYKLEYLENELVKEIEMRRIRDRSRSKDSRIREFIYEWRTYRTWKNDGDVYNHLLYQHRNYNSRFLYALLNDNYIDQNQFKLLSLFHLLHDLPEMIVPDEFAFSKEQTWASEALIIKDLLLKTDVLFDDNEILLIEYLFSELEDPKNMFKLWEMIYYMKWWVSAFKASDYEYFNTWANAITSLVINSLDKLVCEWSKSKDCYKNSWFGLKEDIYIDTCDLMLLAPIRNFFQQYADIINLIICYAYNNYEKLPAAKNINKEKVERAYKKRKEILIPTYKISLWSIPSDILWIKEDVFD